MNTMKIKLVETENTKHVRSDAYNYDFNKKSGFFARWGKTKQDDPQMGLPEIADIEITTKCTGPAGKLCKFCAPAGTKVTTMIGDVDIDTLKCGDAVLSWDGNAIVQNEIVETYEHNYSGELIKIELEDGSTIELTPDHEVFLMDGNTKNAGDLCEGDDVRTYNTSM
jgi:hypothetical protein